MQFCRPISCPFLDQEGVILVIFEPKIGGGGGGGGSVGWHVKRKMYDFQYADIMTV